MTSTRVSPSWLQVATLKREVYKQVKIYPSDYEREDRLDYKLRKRSKLFAEALRKKGWLSEEGYVDA